MQGKIGSKTRAYTKSRRALGLDEPKVPGASGERSRTYKGTEIVDRWWLRLGCRVLRKL